LIDFITWWRVTAVTAQRPTVSLLGGTKQNGQNTCTRPWCDRTYSTYVFPMVRVRCFAVRWPHYMTKTSCKRAAATVCPAPLPPPRGRRSALRRRADGNVAAASNGQHVLTPTAAAAWRANTAVSKAAWWPWSLTFWSWKWCPSHVSVLIFVSLGLSRLRPNVRDRQMSDVARV